MNQKSFEELRLTGQLPSPSGVGMQILRLTQKDDFSTEEIGQAISADSALTGRLLKLANSAESGSVEPVTTIGEATIRLGIKTVGNVALGLSLVSTTRIGSCEQFDYGHYWSQSLARAVAGQGLSRQLNEGVPAEMYIVGLLAGVGSLALASVHPEAYGKLLQSSVKLSGEALDAAEFELFQINHREVSQCILRDWGLPENFGIATSEYEGLVEAGPEAPIDTLSQLLAGAELLAQIMVVNEEASYEEHMRLAEGYDALRLASGIEEDEFQRICSEIASTWREWGTVLEISTAGFVDFGNLHARAELFKQKAETAAGGESQGAGALEKAKPAKQRFARSLNDGSMHILAVDDDPSSLMLLERYLLKAGHRVTTAVDGEDALRKALDSNPDIVVADWDMPTLDGVGLCKALRRIPSGQRVYFILLTGVEGENGILKAFECGVDDYVVKPFNPRILLARVHAGRRIVTLQGELEKERRKQEKHLMDLQVLTRKLRSAALTDPLTGLPNRRYAMKRISQAWGSSSRTGKPMSVIMMDIDFFKHVNDTYGHDAGDEVLKATADALSHACRKDEDVCRIGGEEFIMICAGASVTQAAAGAERVRGVIEAQLIEWQGTTHNVTMSLGVAGRVVSMEGSDDLLKAADQAVYVAKNAGRNQVCVSELNEPNLRKTA
jgi:two-component system cell cycle response regulator